MGQMYRQGDVLLRAVEKLPKDSVERPCESRVVLAWGESTGHAHAINAAFAKMYVSGSNTFLVANPGAKLVHEEHATIDLEPGVYQVIQQREYVPGAIPRYVLD